MGTASENNFLNTYNWLWLGIAAKLYGTYLAGHNSKNRKARKHHSSFKGKDEKCRGRGSHFLNSVVSSACAPCKYTCDSGLWTHSHFREALGFLFSLHFSSGQPATFWSSWLCTLHDWTQLCQTSLRKLTFVYFERKKEKSESQLFPPALLIKRER